MPREHHLFTKRCEIGRYGRTNDSIDHIRLKKKFDRWLVLTFSFDRRAARERLTRRSQRSRTEGIVFMRSVEVLHDVLVDALY
jgi:hypothetical protein